MNCYQRGGGALEMPSVQGVLDQETGARLGIAPATNYLVRRDYCVTAFTSVIVTMSERSAVREAFVLLA